jgi:hypothetical protein
MDPSTGLRPKPTGPPLRPGAKAKPAWLGAASPPLGVPPHRPALPRATSGARPITRSSGSAVLRPIPRALGSYKPLRDKDDNSTSTLSPLLLSNQEAATPIAGDSTMQMGGVSAPSSSVSVVNAANIDGTAGDTANATSGSSFVTQNEMSALLSVLLTVSSRMELVSLQMDDVSSRMTKMDSGLATVTSTLESVSSQMAKMKSTLRSIHEEVRSNQGHITKRLIAPLETRVATLERTTVRLEDDLALKGTALLTTVDDLHKTAASLTTAVNSATHDFGSRLLALEARAGGTSPAKPSPAPKDPPPSEIPSARFSPPPVDATANSRVAWARVHNRVTPPCAPVNAHQQSPGLRQTTLPGAFHPRRSPTRDEEDFNTGSPGPTKFAPSPIRTHPTAADTYGLVGGPITSRRNWDKETQACSLGASRFDILRLACPAYHGGANGTPTLTDDFIQECGFTCIKASANDVVVCYNNIMYVHQKVWELWFNNASNTLGPQVDRILQKSLSVFPRLTSTDTGEVVSFYDRLQEISLNHLLALIPFDAIMLQYRFEELCPPGLGVTRYGAMSKALMELLPRLIPGSTSSPINAALVGFF